MAAVAGGRRVESLGIRIQDSISTEREGFEPSTRVASCNSLAGSRFQPLSHLSSGLMSLSVSPGGGPLPGGLGGGESGQPVLEPTEDFPGDGLAALAPVGGADLLVAVLPQ